MGVYSMNMNFENNLFIGTLIVCFIINVANTGLMITRRKVGIKIIFALLPIVPIVFGVSPWGVYS